MESERVSELKGEITTLRLALNECRNHRDEALNECAMLHDDLAKTTNKLNECQKQNDKLMEKCG